VAWQSAGTRLDSWRSSKCATSLQFVCPESRTMQQSLDLDEPDGTVFVFLDESYDPFVAAAAVVIEATDVHRLDSDITTTYERMQGWYRLGGLPSFEEFRERGFHATSDPPEVQIAFVGLLAEVLNFKSLISYSDGSARADLSEKKRLMIVFDQLLRDVLRAYKGRPKLILYFESAHGMDRYLTRLVSRVLRTSQRKRPEVEIRFGTKRDPDLLAVPDYVLYVFNRWRVTQEGGAWNLDPEKHQARSFKAILGSVSIARSLEHRDIIRRSIDD